MQVGAGKIAENYILMHHQKAEIEILAWHGLFKTSRPIPSDMLLPIDLYLLIFLTFSKDSIPCQQSIQIYAPMEVILIQSITAPYIMFP